MDDSTEPHNHLQSRSTTVQDAVPQATLSNITLNNPPAAQTHSPGVCALVPSDAPTPRRVKYPFYRLRWNMVSLVVSCFLWEKARFDRTIQFAVRDGNQDVICAAGGMLDSGLPMTFLSCEYFNEHLKSLRVQVKMFPNGPRTIFRTIDGKEVRSTGKLNMRFRVEGGTKFINASFFVSEHPIQGCDVLIGADVIGEHWRLVPVGAPGFIEPPPKLVPQHERDKALQAKQEASITDHGIKRAIREQQLQNGTAPPPS